MRWPNLIGKARVQPVKGRWHDWKQEIADHCEGQCVYCAISEARFGGIRNFHIEHFRPKIRFPKLEDDIHNLYLACAVCNVLKCDDWPAEPTTDHSLAAYPDPSQCNYNEIFQTVSASYEITSNTVAGKYVIERILLNRAQLILERRLAAALRGICELETWVDKSLDDLTASEAKAICQILCRVSTMLRVTLNARPYRHIDTHRTTKTKVKKKRLRS